MGNERLIVSTKANNVFLYNPDFTLDKIVSSGEFDGSDAVEDKKPPRLEYHVTDTGENYTVTIDGKILKVDDPWCAVPVPNGFDEQKQQIEEVRRLDLVDGRMYFVRLCAQEYQFFDSDGNLLGKEFHNHEGDNLNHLDSRLHHIVLCGRDYFVVTTNTSNCHIYSAKVADEHLVEMMSFSGVGPHVVQVGDHVVIGMRSDEIRVYGSGIKPVKTISDIAKLDGEGRKIISLKVQKAG